MGTINKFKGHFSRAFNVVFIATGGTKLRMAAERDKFKFATVRTAIHGAAEGRITAVNHFLDGGFENRKQPHPSRLRGKAAELTWGLNRRSLFL